MKEQNVNILFFVIFLVISQFFITRFIISTYYSNDEMKKLTEHLNLVEYSDDEENEEVRAHRAGRVSGNEELNLAERNSMPSNKINPSFSNTYSISKKLCPNKTDSRVKFSQEKIEEIKQNKYKIHPNKMKIDILAELTPLDLDKCLIRLGQKYDGGYVILDHLLDKIEVVYSYGVNDDTMFESQFSNLFNSKMRLYDFSIDKVAYHPNFYFVKEGVGPATDKFKLLDTVENHLRKNNDFGKRKILKLDVEGAEYSTIEQMPESILLEFDQIIMELHSIYEKFNEFKKIILKINKHFYLYHIHSNNYSYMSKHGHNLKLPNVLEICWIKKELVNPEEVYFSNKNYPTSIDAPNTPQKDDLDLNFWPFIFNM